MKVYLVGGAVRDRLLGLKIKDKDWVVVGATPKNMLAKGFRPVGKDFPVFLHPETHEEYALARTERKSGHGYGGFTFYTSPNISLEEDLARRDLTINAMAQDMEGNIFDPYGGQKDLENKKLRHISSAFAEDPLRILRVARFAARFQQDGFSIANETMTLMRKIVTTGEVNHLVAERVWQETSRAIMEPSPATYFNTLIDCGALQIIMPLAHAFFASNSVALAALTSAASDNENGVRRFSCLFPPTQAISSDQLKAFFKQMRFPSAFNERAQLINTYLPELVSIQKAVRAPELTTLFSNTDAYRKPERFIDVLNTSYYLAKANGDELDINKRQLIIKALDECRAVNASAIVAQGYKGKAIGEQLQQVRIAQAKKTLGE